MYDQKGVPLLIYVHAVNLLSGLRADLIRRKPGAALPDSNIEIVTLCGVLAFSFGESGASADLQRQLLRSRSSLHEVQKLLSQNISNGVFSLVWYESFFVSLFFLGIC